MKHMMIYQVVKHMSLVQDLVHKFGQTINAKSSNDEEISDEELVESYKLMYDT